MAAVQLTAPALDRAAGVLVAQACGDALGVPYEFASLLPKNTEPSMIGGGLGPYAPGEYSDDTQMAACIALRAATGAGLTDDESLDSIAESFEEWFASGATDVGSQTRAVLLESRTRPGSPSTRLRQASADLHKRTGHTAGNGALMRTAPVALAHLGDDDALASSARAIAELTHADPLAGDSCVLWCIAIDRAVREARLDGIFDGLSLLPSERRDRWKEWLDEAAVTSPGTFRPNGFTVTALQAAWSSISQTAIPAHQPEAGSFACLHLQHVISNVIRIGGDTDTIAAIAGALLGARWGVSAVPAKWRRVLHGWPGLRSRDLSRLGVLAARRGSADAQGWPSCARMDYGLTSTGAIVHPDDDGVFLGTARPELFDSDEIRAVVSLCRLGRDEVPARDVAAQDHVEFWLIDSRDPADNPNLAFVIDDAARTVANLRNEGKRVLIHCVRAESRTPVVAARYSVLQVADFEQALADILVELHDPPLNPVLRDAYLSLGRWGQGSGLAPEDLIVEWRGDGESQGAWAYPGRLYRPEAGPSDRDA